MGTCTYGSGADMGKPAIGIWYGALCRAYTSTFPTSPGLYLNFKYPMRVYFIPLFS